MAEKPNARESIIQFSQRFFELDWARVSENQRSEGLIRWYVAEVLNRTEARELTDDDVEEAILDGTGDLGGDFYHRTTDGDVLILQSKFRGHGKSESAEDIAWFAGILDRLRSADYKKKARKEVRDFIDEIDWKTDRFDLRYVACSKIEGQALTTVAEHQRRWHNDDSISVHLRYFSETDLNAEFRNAVKLVHGLPSDQLFHVQKGTQVIEIPGETKSCVMVVPGKQLAQLYDQANDALFSTNIRAFLGNTTINKELKETIDKSPENFYYYNNGITCLSTKLDVKDREVSVSGLQVINGAQTVRALAKAEKLKPGATDKVQVLVRITLQTAGYGAGGRFIDNIVRFNNSQNAMKPADFISNDAIQGWLHKEFGRSKRLGKEVVYQNKRTSVDVTGKETIPIDDFAKSVYSFLYDPIKFSTGSTFFFTPGKEKGYYRVFGDGDSLFEPPMDSEEFRLRSAIWWMSKEFAAAMKTDKKTGKYGAALERKHFILFAARLILERNFGSEYRAVLAKFSKGDWRVTDTTMPGTFFRKLYEKARQVVVYVYKKDEDAEKESFNQRNWMRSQKTQDAIQIFCNEGPGLDDLGEMLKASK